MYNSSNRERSFGRPSNGQSGRSNDTRKPASSRSGGFSRGGASSRGEGGAGRTSTFTRGGNTGGSTFTRGGSHSAGRPSTFTGGRSNSNSTFSRGGDNLTGGTFTRGSDTRTRTGSAGRSSYGSRSGGDRGGSRGGFSGGSRSGGSFGGGRSGGGRRFQGKYISEEKFINKNPKVQEQISYIPNHTFAEFGFDDQIVANLVKKGYINPTRIQDESIPHLLNGKNVIGLANTGSGKTAAFSLPILHKLKNRKDRQTALIIAPTRELANQIEDEIKIFSQGMGIYTALCVGGMSIGFQKRALYKNPQIIIGTPGRLKDLYQQKSLRLENVGTLVLDEADRMLDMGFLKDIEFLISKLSEKPQSLCFSATITPDISKIIDKIMPEHVTISVRTSETAEHIAQDVIKVTSGDHKLDMLLQMLREPHFEKVLIFGEMKHSVQRLAETLTQAGFPSEAIHGNKSQVQRNRSLAAFKTGRVNVLVATDVAARGLDIPNVTHVINFDKPHSYEDYIHRIGRTGRAGKDGQAYTFIQH
jgi:superfamily II DNA/RNA helicase